MVPLWYPCFDSRCDERVSHTLHVNVSSYEGTWSRSSRDSGAWVDVLFCGGVAALDSKRTVEGSRVLERTTEGRVKVDVRGVCMRRFEAAGMCSAGRTQSARGAVVRAHVRNKDTEERMMTDIHAIKI